MSIEKTKNTASKQIGATTKLLRTVSIVDFVRSLELSEYRPADFDGFFRLYSRVFAEPPWCERWTRLAVKKEVDQFLGEKNPNFILAKAPIGYKTQIPTDSILGFSVAYTVDPTDADWLPEGLRAILLRRKLPIVYGKDLAVEKSFRRMWIGKMMIEARIQYYESLFPEGFDIIGRTDVSSKMVPFYERLGYCDTGFRDPAYPSRTYFMKTLLRMSSQISQK